MIIKYNFDIDCLLLTVFFVFRALMVISFDHNKATFEKGCIFCHVDFVSAEKLQNRLYSNEKQIRNIYIKSNASKWCISCHIDIARVSHKLGVLVQIDVDIPLEEGRKIGCITCHSPHGESFASTPWCYKDLSTRKSNADNVRYKAYLLNKPNAKGELCLDCHGHSKLRKLEKFNDLKLHNFSGHFARSIIQSRYVGSSTCGTCHYKNYNLWKKTTHARMTRRLGDVEDIDKVNLEELGYDRSKIEWVLGSHYVYRFVAIATNSLIVLPRIWDINRKEWLNIYDYDWHRRDWHVQCAGCHTTGYFAEGKSFVEPGIGCEACHGPGYNHVTSGNKDLIVNPIKLDDLRKEMICMSCHTSGVDISGKYHYPVGYLPGDDLSKFFWGLTPKPGQDLTNFFGDETIDDRLRQWNFLKGRQFLATGLTCDYCQNFRNFTVKNKDDRQNLSFMSINEYCQTCHNNIEVSHVGKYLQNNYSNNLDCLYCHVPMRNLRGEISIHDHRFIFEKK